MAHKNLHYLTDRLPKSNYNNGHEYEKITKLNQSTKEKVPYSLKHPPEIRSINLPKIDRLILKNAVHKNIEDKRKN